MRAETSILRATSSFPSGLEVLPAAAAGGLAKACGTEVTTRVNNPAVKPLTRFNYPAEAWWS